MLKFLHLFTFLSFATAMNTYAQNTGIGTTTPSEKLEVIGNIKTSDTLKANHFSMPTGSGAGKILTSDTVGNASWQAVAKPTTNIVGYVRLLDIFGNTITSGLANTVVNIEGTSILTTTDSTGKFIFANMPSNYYNIVASRAGYGTDKMQAVLVQGGGADAYVGSIKISQVPSFSPTSIATTIVGGEVVVNGNISATSTYKRAITIFIGTSNAVSATPATYFYTVSGTIAANASTYLVSITAPMLTAMGIPSGTTLYVRAYGTNMEYAASSSYTDLSTGRKIYTALGAPSTVASFVKP